MKHRRISKDDAALLMVDHRAGLISLVQDFSPNKFENNVPALAACGKYFKLPTMMSRELEQSSPTIFPITENLMTSYFAGKR